MLADCYAYPSSLSRPYVRANFVSSADGAVSVDAVSGGLKAPGDREVFDLLRDLADVIVVGAGTVRAEGYRGARTSAGQRARRRARGQSDVPRIAVVTASASLDSGAALFTDTAVAPLVLTTSSAAAESRRRLRDLADVISVGEHDVSPAQVLTALSARGMYRVLCEGGPQLLGTFAAAGLLDELCLSLAPQLAGPGPGRIIAGPELDSPIALELASVLAHGDGLLLRYRAAS
jgi:riboflavin biosynthesis pyrimidine reductase